MSISAFPFGTHMFHQNLGAVLTVHLAAPVELAVATAHDLRSPLFHPQPALMAQPAAAPLLPLGQSLSVLHTLPALGAVKAQRGVPPAVVRGILLVDELRLRDAAQGVRDGAPVVRAVPRSPVLLVYVKFLSLAVLHLQVVAYVSKIGQLSPAGLDAAALRHTVTSADALHGCLHGLWENRDLFYNDCLSLEVCHQTAVGGCVKLTRRPASLLCRFTAALESWPVSCASTYCLEILSPNSTLSLQPPHNQPRPPGDTVSTLNASNERSRTFLAHY